MRNALFRRVMLAALRRYDELGQLDVADGWTARAWEDALDGYFDLYDDIGTGADARGPAMLIVEEGSREWTVRQIFDDPAGDPIGAFPPASTWLPQTKRAPRLFTLLTSGSFSRRGQAYDLMRRRAASEGSCRPSR